MASSNDLDSLSRLQTEACDSLLARTIDSLNTQELCGAFLHEESRVSRAIACCLPTIASFVDELVPRLASGARLIYVGAGNSGRVAFMDCSELPATFSADPDRFLAVVAGGTAAVIRAREEAEDSEADGATALQALAVGPSDTVIGISASGRTPFVLGALNEALRVGALTAGITSNHPSGISRLGVKYAISALVGPEFIAGSTRLKAGSASKQILNLISTCSMIKLGKTYMGLMLDVRVNNEKLRARGRRILRQVCGSGPLYLLSEDGAPSPRLVDIESTAEGNHALDIHIKCCGGSVKLACAVAISGATLSVAKAELNLANGKFHEYLQRLPRVPMPTIPQPQPFDTELFLAIDGGGTNCTVSIATRSGIVARGTAGACNVNCVTMEELIEQINIATARAVRVISTGPLRYLAGSDTVPRFTKVWAAIAGLHHAYKPEELSDRLEEIFSVSVQSGSLRLTSDDMLLSSCLGVDDSVNDSIAVIAGTGSVATAFRKTTDGKVVQIGRTGGWGHLIGDQGSAFDLGRAALQAVLTSLEQRQGEETRPRLLSELESAVLARLGCCERDLLPSILHHSSGEPKLRIADLAKVVTELGFRKPDPDPQSLVILKSAARSVVGLIRPLAREQICNPPVCSLIMSGALLNVSAYRDLVLDEWLKLRLPSFQKVMVVDDVSGCAAQFLAKTIDARAGIRVSKQQQSMGNS